MSAAKRGDFTTRREVKAPRAEVFAAFGTPEGIASWWTPDVRGSAAAGGKLKLMFGDFLLELRVDATSDPENVTWTCTSCPGLPDWEGTSIQVDLRELEPARTVVTLTHRGLVPELSWSPWVDLAQSWHSGCSARASASPNHSTSSASA